MSTHNPRHSRVKASRNAVLITRDLAFASGQDAGNAQMRKACRKAWNEDDYNVAAELTNRLLMHVPFEQGGLQGIPVERLIADGLIAGPL